MAYILLSSAKNARELTRAFQQYETRDEMAKTIIDYFEDYLRTTSPEEEGLEYASDMLFEFIDEFFDELVCLERQPNCFDLYTPYTTTWVKECVYAHLRSQCGIADVSHDMKNSESNGLSSQIAMEIN